MDRVRSAGSSKVSARRRRALIALALAVVLVSYSVPIPVSAADGATDTFFDSDGKLTTDFSAAMTTRLPSPSNRTARSSPPGVPSMFGTFDFALARYNADGRLDTTFDSDGKLTTDFFGSDNAATAVAVQSDGKIVVAGYAWNQDTGTPDFALARYNADGRLDTTFDSDGKLTTDFFSLFGSFDIATAVAVQSDGKIVAAGYAETFWFDSDLTSDFALARYNADGSLDTTFDSDGKLTTDFFGGGGRDDEAIAVAVQSDGKIVAAGYSSPNADFALARYNADGSLDTTFDSDGRLTTDFFGFGRKTGVCRRRPIGRQDRRRREYLESSRRAH